MKRRINMEAAEQATKATLDGALTDISKSVEQVEAEQDAAREAQYAADMEAIDRQEAADMADIEARKRAIDGARNVLVNSKPVFATAIRSNRNVANRIQDFALDTSTIRARFTGYGDTIADALTDFVAATAIESVALPVLRVTALSRIVNDEKAVKVISGQDKYKAKKSPVSAFLQDVLDLSKQQISAYLRVVRVCVDPETHELKPDFRGFSFTQLDVLSGSRNPVENAQAVDADLTMGDFKASVARLDTEWETVKANQSPSGQPDETNPDANQSSSGQPDETNPDANPDAKPEDAKPLVHFVVGLVPESNAYNFNPMRKSPDTDETIVIKAVNLNAAVSMFCDTQSEDRVMFRLPKPAEKAILEKLPAAFSGYSVKAIIADVAHVYSRAALYALCTVETVGTDESAESTKQAAKRIETGRLVLANWLTGAAQLEGIPNAVDVENAMEIFTKAYDMVKNVSRMSAQVAIADLYKSGDFKVTEG